MRLLIVEDEREIAKTIQTILEHSKYAVDVVYDGDEAIDYILSGVYDGILLDIMLPGKDGLEVLRECRAKGISTPVLLLTARGEVEDRVTGLDAGADDYLPKPFAVSELLARVRALLRRSGSYMADVLSVGNLRLDRATYELATPKQTVRLNNKEYQLMEFFMRNPRKVLSTELLMEHIWGWDSRAEVNVVWTNIAYLRRKLDQLEASAEIQLVRGVGYCLTEKKL